MMGEHRLLNKSIHTRGRVTLNHRYYTESVGSCVEWRGVRELREIARARAAESQLYEGTENALFFYFHYRFICG